MGYYDLGGEIADRIGSLIPVPASGDTSGATDAAAINATLAAGGLVKLRAGGTYYINSVLVGGQVANTTLDAAGATINGVQTAGLGCLVLDIGHYNLLNSGSWVASTNFRVIGGTWVKNNVIGINNGLHMMILGGSGATVKDASFQSTGGKYAVLFQNATDFVAENIFLNGVNSDGVHIQGPAARGVVRNVHGTAGDDLVAITPIDFASYTWGNEGDVTDVLVDGVFPVSCPTNAVKVLSGNNGAALNTKRITVQNVAGTMTSAATAGVYLGDDASSSNTQQGNLDSVTVDGVDVTGLAATQEVVLIQGTTNSVTIPKLTLRNLKLNGDLTSVVQQNSKITSLVIDGVQGATAANPLTAVFNHANNSWVSTSRVVLSNVDVTFTTTRGGSLVHAVTSGQTLSEIIASNVYINNSAWLADLITSTTVRCANVHVANNGGVLNVRSPAAVVVQGWHGCTADNTSSTITSTGTVESLARDFVLDINNAQVVKNNGDRCTTRATAGTIAAGQSVEYVTATAHWYDIRGNLL